MAAHAYVWTAHVLSFSHVFFFFFERQAYQNALKCTDLEAKFQNISEAMFPNQGPDFQKILGKT